MAPCHPWPRSSRPAQLGNPVGRQHLAPDCRSLVVPRDACLSSEDGGVQPVGWYRPHLGEESPGKGDCFGFEVVPEREVAEHFEERVVASEGPTLSRSLCLPLTRMHFWAEVARR